ncbi:hypothetical protein [Desulfoscipio gibsoniae]|uniref:DUF4878 domain-containing protein n=1 Tax=Desulfoscipio gibsoniae DSM 7213 TaxID=767817 RepID=R4K8Z8_9FIRM|nr:hypothetical protein [Desulfoscipio gibsoniae]AGK99657.1 hypothetical protein Desgi_0037 [Desulfoscipio gibsoniae DSM 7213]
MKPKSLLTILVLVLTLLIGCGENNMPKESPEPKAEPPEKVAQSILEYMSYQQWQQLYKYLHPDTRALITEDEFIKMKEDGPVLAIESYQVKEPVLLNSWTDSKGTGKTYKNVAEIPFEITVNLVGNKQPYKASMHLVQDEQGAWKYFSDIPKKD